jgi:hypothetical protein
MGAGEIRGQADCEQLLGAALTLKPRVLVFPSKSRPRKNILCRISPAPWHNLRQHLQVLGANLCVKF